MRYSLKAHSVAATTGWSWLLVDSNFGVNHRTPVREARVNPDMTGDVARAALDLEAYLRQNANPLDPASEQALLQRVGKWIAEELLSPSVVEALRSVAPCSVELLLPDTLTQLAQIPFELAGATDNLADAGVFFLLNNQNVPRPHANTGQGAGLRILAVFGQPKDHSVLDLRRERYDLAQVVNEVRAQSGRDVHLEILQYGATRRRLADLLSDGNGWDILHLSCHGNAQSVALEHDDGTADSVDADDLSGLLRAAGPAQHRLKAVFVMACESGAAAAERWLSTLGLPSLPSTGSGGVSSASNNVSGHRTRDGLAQTISKKLSCSVVGMRFLVEDEFAVQFSTELYRFLLGNQHQLASAVPLAREQSLRLLATHSPCSALSRYTPVLYGRGEEAFGTTGRIDSKTLATALSLFDARMAMFPDEPRRFVGRTDQIRAVRTSWGRPSGRATGAVLHGMSGSGKTACGLEIAYQTVHLFQYDVYWDAQSMADTPFSALPSFARAMDLQLGHLGFEMSSRLNSDERLTLLFGQMRRLCERNAILIFLDNIETLVDDSGEWIDDRWRSLLEAFTDHDGPTRIIITSRTQPRYLNTTRVLDIPIGTLSMPEAALLASRLPRLRYLARLSPTELLETERRDSIAAAFLATQGHPKLLEFLGAAADDLDVLSRGTLPRSNTADEIRVAMESFGRTSSGLLTSLQIWTLACLRKLDEDEQLVVRFICSIAPSDRTVAVASVAWERFATTSGPQTLYNPLDFEVGLAEASRLSLLDEESVMTPGHGVTVNSLGRTDRAYRIHPAVQDAILQDSSPDDIRRARSALRDHWLAVVQHNINGNLNSNSMLRAEAAMRAAHYLVELGEWESVGPLVETALHDDSRAPIKATGLDFLRRVAEATGRLEDEASYANELASQDPEQGRQLLIQVLDKSIGEKRFDLAWVLTRDLQHQLRASGGPADELAALRVRRHEYFARSNLGPWSSIANELDRHMDALDGGLDSPAQARDLLADLEQLANGFIGLPSVRTSDELVDPASIIEATYDLGRKICWEFGDWDGSLKFNQLNVASKLSRNASPLTISCQKMWDYYPLYCTGRANAANQMLVSMQDLILGQASSAQRAAFLGARSTVFRAIGNPEQALSWQKESLRLKYLARDLPSIFPSHHNLANLAAPDSDLQIAHRLIAAVYEQFLRKSLSGKSRMMTARTLLEASRQDDVLTFDLICALVEQSAGVEVNSVMMRHTGQHMLNEVRSAVATTSVSKMYADKFGSLLDDVTLAFRGDEIARQRVLDFLFSAPDHLSEFKAAVTQLVTSRTAPSIPLTGWSAREVALLKEMLRRTSAG